MKIFIATLGSRGDVQPYVALGKGLKAAGHTVTLCTSSSFEAFVAEHGLAYGYMNDGFMQLMHSDEGRDALENTTNLWGAIKTLARLWKRIGPLGRRMLRDSWEAAQQADPDLIIFHPKAAGAIHFAEKLGVPVVMAALIPQLVPTAAFPSIGFPAWRLGGWYNRLTYALVLRLTNLIGGKYIREWRTAHGLPPQPRGTDVLHTSTGAHLPVLHAYSQHVVPDPADWPDEATTTSYWFLDRPEAWQPPGALQHFLEAGSPPVYVGFGSMAGREPQRLTQIVLEALQQAKVRGVIATGWGGLAPEDLPDTIFSVDHIPHDWLFPRVAAVVHHGGAGTTAAGLRAGRPTIICPFFGDQPFWGRRVHALGVGSNPLPQKELTAPKLAAAIREVTTNRILRRRAEALGEKIRQEDGVATAVALIEGLQTTV